MPCNGCIMAYMGMVWQGRSICSFLHASHRFSCWLLPASWSVIPLLYYEKALRRFLRPKAATGGMLGSQLLSFDMHVARLSTSMVSTPCDPDAAPTGFSALVASSAGCPASAFLPLPVACSLQQQCSIQIRAEAALLIQGPFASCTHVHRPHSCIN